MTLISGTDADVLNAIDGDGSAQLTVLVIGSEFGKGSGGTNGGREQIIQPEYDSYTNNTVIQRDMYAFQGTDANQIGWVEIADENGVQGKYWYLKGKSEVMTRWMDYQELLLLEDEQAAAGSGALTAGKGNHRPEYTTQSGRTIANAGFTGGSEGLFAAVRDRGNVTSDLFDIGAGAGSTQTGGIASNTNAFLATLDSIVETLDQEGNIEENVFFLDRQQSLRFDDGMAAQGNGASTTATSWGLFNNSEMMGLSFGFNSARRGSYDFYKKDWKYLNQVDGRGSLAGIRGISVPMGTKSVYDQYGANLSLPFASIHYLAGPQANRKNQTWAHGGQAPTPTSGIDDVKIEFLSEKCICVKGANNFILFQ